ncbi:MAG: gliding motility-associated C-terminal domain-containing protein, partial [Polaribacter sp.]|nr:gliding motility-associated C-terminal domain-containing protein [Polaribacter sp.]
ATNVSLVDILPNGVTYLSDNSSGSYNSGSGIWTIGTIQNTETKTLDIEARVDLGTNGLTITNKTSNLNVDETDTDASNNIGFVDIIPVRDVDLSLVKSFVDNDGAPVVGNIKTFEIIISNSGSSIATGVQVTDNLPSGYKFISYSSTTGVYNENTGIWNVGTVIPGNDLVLLIEVEVLGTGDYENCAEITMMNEVDIDSTPGNGDVNEDDYSCASISFGNSLDLGVQKSIVGNNLTPSVGDDITFNIELINYGLLDVTTVEVEDILPSGYTFKSSQSTSGTYDISNGIWSVSNVVKETSEVLTIVATINSSGNYENCSTIISSSINDSNQNNDSSCVLPAPSDLIDLELTKTVSNTNPNALDEIEFIIQVTNKGPSIATGIEILDLLPNGYNFISFSATQGDYNETNGIWDLGSALRVGESESISIQVNVLPIGVWNNTAQVQFANETDIDSTPGNNQENEDDQDSVQVDVDIKTFIPEEFTPNGDGINDTFEIRNLQVLYPNFRMVIVNRWGSQVYEYEHNGNKYEEPQWWDGFSKGKMNIGNQMLPNATYYYSIEFKDGNRKPITGWVYLRK